MLDKEKFELKICYKFLSALQILSTTEQSTTDYQRREMESFERLLDLLAEHPPLKSNDHNL